MNKYIYMKKFYILTVLFALLGISNVWAAWEGSGSAVKYENGTYYVVYELDEQSVFQTGSYDYNLSGPGAKLTFDAKRTALAIQNLVVQDDFAEIFNEYPKTSYQSYGPVNVNVDSKKVTFKGATAATLSRQFKNVKLTMAQYLEAPSKTKVAFDAAFVDAAPSEQTITIAWCNVPAMTFELSGDDKAQFNVELANNAEAGKYGTATFTISYKHDIVGSHDAALVITDSYGSYSKTINISGETKKRDNAITWNLAEGWKDWNETITLDATSNSDEKEIVYEINKPEFVSVEGNVVTFLEAGAGQSVKITASQEESEHYKAASAVSKTFSIKRQQEIVWDAEKVNTNLRIGVARDIAEYASAKYETAQNIVYTSADESIVSVEGTVLTPLKAGDVEITATLAGDEQNRPAVETKKTFTVKEKESVVIKQGDAIIEQNGTLTLYLGQTSGVISSNNEGALSVNIKDESIAKYNAETKQIEALALGTTELTFAQEGTDDFYPYESKVTLKVELVPNTLALFAENAERFVADAIENVIVEESLNSNGAITSESTDATIAYFDAENNKIFIPNSENKSFKETTVTITIRQAAEGIYAATEKTIELTVAKRANTITVNGEAEFSTKMFTDNTLALTIASNNNEDAIEVEQLLGQNVATLENGIVTSNYTVGTAQWRLTQAESAAYLAAKMDFTVKVEREDEATDCYVLTELSEHHVSAYTNNDGLRYELSDEGETLYIRVGKQSDITTNTLHIYGYDKNDTEIPLAEYGVGELSSEGSDKEIPISADIVAVKIQAGGTLYKWFSNLRVTRRTRLNVEATAIETHPTEEGVGQLTVDYSLANGGDLKIVSDNDQFSFEPATIADVDCKSGVANVKVIYAPQEEEKNDIANVVIYNGVYYKELQIVAQVSKITPVITWEDIDMKVNDSVELAATSDQPEAEIQYEIVGETDVIRIENGKIYATNGGDAQVRAFIESSAKFNVAEKTINVHVITTGKQTITWEQELHDIKTGDIVELTATASSGLTVTYTSSDENIDKIEDGKLVAVAPGMVTITATQDGNEEFEAAEPVVRVININDPEDTREEQFIIWDDDLPMLGYNDPDYQIIASATSALEVSFISSDSTIAYVDENGWIIINHRPGVVTITAIQEGDETFKPAEPISKTLHVLDTPSAIDNEQTRVKAVKILRDGQVLILRDGRVYSINGSLVMIE